MVRRKTGSVKKKTGDWCSYRTNSTITTKGDENVPIPHHNTDKVKASVEIKGGVQDMPLLLVPGDDTYKLLKDNCKPLPFESKDSSRSKEETSGGFSCTPTREGVKKPLVTGKQVKGQKCHAHQALMLIEGILIKATSTERSSTNNTGPVNLTSWRQGW